MRALLKISLWAVAGILAAVAPARAQQRYRSERRIVRGGIMEKPDTLRKRTGPLPTGADSLLAGADSLLAGADSLAALLPDSLATSFPDSLATSFPDSLRQLVTMPDSTARALLDRTFAEADSLARQLALPAAGVSGPDSLLNRTADTLRRERRPFISDSMSLSKVCWLSLPLPGFGQIYNKQYWKLPILYGTLGATIGLFIHENHKYKPLKREYTAITDLSTERTPELDALQARMIRSNTRRQLYLGAAIASYIYFIGDAAVKYSTNEVSNVKKATTLACICPGAGQIYNRSYWKVPFVVGGFASMIYCIDWNNRGFQRFKKAYQQVSAYEKALQEYNGLPAEQRPEQRPEPTDEFRGRYTSDYLKNLKDNYRRNRDLCIIVSAGLYILQIVDAHVDAHLKDYDISDDLSMTLEPSFDYTYVPAQGEHRPIFGFNLGVKF